MSKHRLLRSVHLAGTIWFMLCVGLLLIVALRRAGLNWLFIFSLSGHSALIIILLVSLYLFAIFRGIRGTQSIEEEHPLTSTDYYMALYVSAPLLGAIAGSLGVPDMTSIGYLVISIALGTLATAFIVWVIVDPLVALLEMLKML